MSPRHPRPHSIRLPVASVSPQPPCPCSIRVPVASTCSPVPAQRCCPGLGPLSSQVPPPALPGLPPRVGAVPPCLGGISLAGQDGTGRRLWWQGRGRGKRESVPREREMGMAGSLSEPQRCSRVVGKLRHSWTGCRCASRVGISPEPAEFQNWALAAPTPPGVSFSSTLPGIFGSSNLPPAERGHRPGPMGPWGSPKPPAPPQLPPAALPVQPPLGLTSWGPL